MPKILKEDTEIKISCPKCGDVLKMTGISRTVGSMFILHNLWRCVTCKNEIWRLQ